MTLVDAALYAVIAASLLVGLFRGFIREFVSIATLVAASAAALQFGPQLTAAIAESLHVPGAARAAAYTLIFLGVYLAGVILSLLLGRVARSGGLFAWNLLFGAVFGLIRGALLVTALVMGVAMTPASNAAWWRGSQVATDFSPYAGELRDTLPQEWLAPFENRSLAGTVQPVLDAARQQLKR